MTEIIHPELNAITIQDNLRRTVPLKHSSTLWDFLVSYSHQYTLNQFGVDKMRIDPLAAKEHDEIVNVTSAKGDKATYKINKMNKHVYIQTLPGDGNEMEWRLSNVSYDAIAHLLANPPTPLPTLPTATAVIEPKPVDIVDPFSRPASPAEDE